MKSFFKRVAASLLLTLVPVAAQAKEKPKYGEPAAVAGLACVFEQINLKYQVMIARVTMKDFTEGGRDFHKGEVVFVIRDGGVFLVVGPDNKIAKERVNDAALAGGTETGAPTILQMAKDGLFKTDAPKLRDKCERVWKNLPALAFK